MADVERLLVEAEGLAAQGRHHEALHHFVVITEHPDATVAQAAAARVDAVVAAVRMYDLHTAHDLLLGCTTADLPDPSADRLRLLGFVVHGLLGDPLATDRLVADVNRRLDGPLPAGELRFLAEGLALAVARSGRRDDLLDVVLRAAGMAHDAGQVEVVTTLLVAEAAYRSRSDLAGAAHVSARAVRLAVASNDWRNLPFALAQSANACAGLGDPTALDHADQLERFGAPAAIAVAELARASYALTTGDPEAAYERFLAIERRFGDQGTPSISWHADLVELALARGEVDLARRVTDAVRALAGLSDMPWLLATADRCEGLITRDRVEAERLVEQALTRFEAGDYVISAARTRFAWSQRLRALGDPAWTDLAATAGAGFTRAGMDRWAQRCATA